MVTGRLRTVAVRYLSSSRCTESSRRLATSAADARHQALGIIAQTVEQQATILAYIDVFWSYAVFAILMIAIAILLRRVDQSGGSGGMAG